MTADSPFPELPPEIATRVAAARAGSLAGRVGSIRTGAQNKGPAQNERIGDDEISPAEMRVLEQICAGLSNQAMTTVLFLSEETVKSHVRQMLARCRCANRAQLAYRWGRGELSVVRVRGATKVVMIAPQSDRT